MEMAKGVWAAKPKEFEMRGSEYYQGGYSGTHGTGLPSVRKMVDWMSSEDNRDFLSEIISAGRRAFRMLPVRTNEELMKRIEEYFSIVQGRRVPPTVEEFCLYLGLSVQGVRDRINCVVSGFPDIQMYGTTSEILIRAMDVLHTADAIQAMRKMSDNSVYIFRSKNYYGMQDTKDQPITINLTTPDALPPEQIAKLLPELVPDRSMEGVEVI